MFQKHKDIQIYFKQYWYQNLKEVGKNPLMEAVDIFSFKVLQKQTADYFKSKLKLLISFWQTYLSKEQWQNITHCQSNFYYGDNNLPI